MKAKRLIRIEGDIAFVPLTKGYEAIIDVGDIPLVENNNWCAMVQEGGIYAVYNAGGETIRMHRVILCAPDGTEVDHKKGCGLDNRRPNLRFATRAQNGRNRKISANNTSGFKGVCWHKRAGKWQAKIKFDGKRIYLGHHSTPEEAYAAYCQAAIKLHGEFARL